MNVGTGIVGLPSNPQAGRSGSNAGRPARSNMIPLLVALACSAATVSCAGDDVDGPSLTSAQQSAPALTAATDTGAASVAALRMAVADFLARAGAAPTVEYSIARLDLDADGTEDGLVLLTGTEWCGSAGCTLL